MSVHERSKEELASSRRYVSTRFIASPLKTKSGWTLILRRLRNWELFGFWSVKTYKPCIYPRLNSLKVSLMLIVGFPGTFDFCNWCFCCRVISKVVRLSPRSFMNTKKRVCPRTLPWGTPDKTRCYFNMKPSRTACNDRWRRKSANTSYSPPSVP